MPAAVSARSIYFGRPTLPWWTVHAATVAGVWHFGWSWSGFGLAVIMYYIRMFFVTAGYHRYFSHRSFKTSRAFQFILALLGQTAAQMGALWWAAKHREHHKHSDQPPDLHSPKQDGFWWSHLGWHLSGKVSDTDMAKIADFAKYPELVWLNKRGVGLLPPAILALSFLPFGGVWAMLWGFFVSTVLLWHGTFTINSLAHMFGRRRYVTTDTSRNSMLLALLTMGEGWHNNHHHHQSSVKQGFFWWEIDMTYYILRLLALFGVVWDLRKPTAAALASQRV